MTAYRDHQGRILFVHCGISGGKTWGTYYRKSPTHLRRVVSPALKLRETREQAQADLDAYAKKMRLSGVEIAPEEVGL
jgi:hypothetical protein